MSKTSELETKYSQVFPDDFSDWQFASYTFYVSLAPEIKTCCS